MLSGVGCAVGEARCASRFAWVSRLLPTSGHVAHGSVSSIDETRQPRVSSIARSRLGLPSQTRVTVTHTSVPSPISMRGAAPEVFASGTERELTGSLGRRRPPCRCVTADGAAGRPTARGIREPGLQLPLTARQARAQASLRGPHPQPARRPPPVHWVRGVLALRGAVRRLGAPLQGQGQLPARELRRARARGDICDPAQA